MLALSRIVVTELKPGSVAPVLRTFQEARERVDGIMYPNSSSATASYT
jgi:hypothetical protein